MAARHFEGIKSASTSASDSYQLSPEQLRFYQHNGYLVIQKLIGLPALDSYRRRFVDFCHGRLDKSLVTVVKDRSLYKMGANPEHYTNKMQELLFDEVFSTYSEDPRLLHIVAQLIGEDLTALNCMLINKPPGTGEHEVHQDMPYFPINPMHKVLTTWTAIDPARRDNGCLFVIPGSQESGEVYQLREYHNSGKYYAFGVEDPERVAPVHKRMYLEMEPGDTVFFSPLLVHGSNPNHSKEYRKAMTCHFANSKCHYTEVSGSIHEPIATRVEEYFRKQGINLSFVDFMRMKTRPVKGVRCNL